MARAIFTFTTWCWRLGTQATRRSFNRSCPSWSPANPITRCRARCASECRIARAPSSRIILHVENVDVDVDVDVDVNVDGDGDGDVLGGIHIRSEISAHVLMPRR